MDGLEPSLWTGHIFSTGKAMLSMVMLQMLVDCIVLKG